ncbi:hypothetical protein PhCBS80983_g03792 [Powellomyces hirtus]|uniref:Mediator of RNA polymerase II transcription subunit 8 n=1 Tax=Powellomyces hirtus TaxID=109895 RepID=A0A507E2B6_9FUNG|nr:hypothetical protein PhCBS80983_g03792 [Powellomyces hirtus]
METEPDLDRIINLEALRNRLTHLSESLQDFLHLQDNSSWPTVLSQFNVLVARYESLLGEVRTRKDWLSGNIVIPSTVIAEAPDWIPNVLLRTRVDPVIEDEEKAIQDGIEANSSEINYLDEAAVLEARQVLESQMEEHDEHINNFVQHLQEQQFQQELKKRLPEDKEDDGLAARFVEETGQENKRDLERALMWISSGPESWEEEKRRVVRGKAF